MNNVSNLYYLVLGGGQQLVPVEVVHHGRDHDQPTSVYHLVDR